MCHPKKPLIGSFASINGRRIQDLLQKVLKAMDDFAREHVMRNENDGYHLCLYLSSGTNISITINFITRFLNLLNIRLLIYANIKIILMQNIPYYHVENIYGMS